MSLKFLKFWHGWFDAKPADDIDQTAAAEQTRERKPPATITVRTALRQKQKMSKAAAQ